MKKILVSLLAASLMLLGTSAYAQIAIGAGYAQSKHTLAGKKATTSSPTNGFYAGIDYNVPVGEIFGLSAGVNYEYLMSKTYSLSSILSGDIKEQYINVPVRINAGFDLSDDVRLFLFGGPTFSYALSGMVDSGSGAYDVYEHHDYKRFDVLVGGGAGLDLMDHFRLTVSYDLGLFNTYPSIGDREAAAKLTRNSLRAGLAFIF